MPSLVSTGGSLYSALRHGASVPREELGSFLGKLRKLVNFLLENSQTCEKERRAPLR